MIANAISNMIIKAADNMNRGVENASEAGEGNNGVDYSNVSTGSEGGSVGGGYQKPEEQDTSGTQGVSNAISKIADAGKDALSNIGNNEEEKKEDGTTSDERLKRIFGDNEDAIKAFAKLDSIKFTYNDKAKEIHPNEENGVDDDLHYGIKAQDLEKNPFTAAVVSKDPEGYKQIDPAELTAANTGVVAEICKRLLIIEKVLGIKVV
jgi:hypothetical protein